MPLVRYEIRNEYSLANAELYRSAGKDDPQALLEGVAMAGLVGIVRQLGDLAEFAAEIFHDLHEEVMATAARGHGLMIRVQQLEAEFPSVEKALMSEKNQLRFAYATGADWHASIRNDQNHLTQGDLPRFILNSYEECRGPPRLFLLDKFDVAGAGACLKRYTDPSFFKMEWASTELMKAEKAQRDKKARRVKKKGRRRRNGDTTDVTPVNSRVRYSSLDLDHPKCIPSNLVNMSNQKLKSKEIDRSPLLKQQIVRDHTKGPLNISSPHEDERVHEKFSVRFDKRLNSKHFYASPVQDQVIGRQYVESPYKKSLSSEDVHESSSREWEEKPAVRVVHRVKLADNLTTVSSTEPLSSRIIAEVDAERVPKNFIHEEQKDVLVHNERKSEINVVEDENEDVASEAENYMDALTTMEYEMETDSESRTKQEVDSDINSEHKETGEELHERSAQFSEFANAEATAFYNCDSSDESSKVETSSGFFYKKPADVSSNAESTSHTVNTTSESDSANVDLNRRLDSGPLSLGTSKEDLAFAFDDGSSLASEAHKNFQVTSDEKLHEIHAQCSEFTDAKDFALDNCDSSDKSSKVENSLGFFNNNLADVSSNEESTSYTLNATSECAAAKVDLNRRVYSEHDSLGTSKEDSDSDFDNGSSFLLESLKYDQIPLDEKLQSEADITAKEEMLNFIDVPPAVTDARSHVVISNVETNNFVNGEFSSFTNNYRTDSFTNAEAIAGIDDGEVPFRFPTFESSLLGTEELQTPYKEPMSISECFDGIVAGANLQISSPKVHKDEDNDDYHVFSNSIINESAATSELAAGIENGIMQDNHKCIDLQTDDTEYEMAEPIRDDPSDTQNVQLLSGPSSPGLVGQISVESDVNIDHSEYSAESMPQDSLYDEYIGSSMDYKLIDKQHCPDRCLDHVPAMKPATVIGDNEEPPEYACEREALKPTVGSQDSDLAESKSTESTLHVRPLNVPRCLDHVPAMKPETVIGDNEEPPEYACEREALKPIVGSQDSDLAESKSTESALHVRPLNVSPQLNVPDGYRGDQVTENSSSNTLLTEDSTVCSAVNFGATSDGTNLLVKDIGDDITQKEVNIHSEEPVALDSATVKFPFLTSISDNACRNELSNEFPGAETSVNDGVLPDGSPHSRSTELCGDGGPFENGISIESHSNLHLRAPNELFSSPPSTNSFSKNVHMDSPHAESDMQILYAIPPVKPNVTPHSRSVGHFSDGGSFENNVDIESHGNLQHGTPTEVFSSLASTNSFSEKVHPYSLHADSDMQILHAIPPVKPVGAEPLAESPTNFPKTEVHDGELSSPPLEHIKISFPPTSDSPLSMYSTSSDRVSESPSLERRQLSKRKADDLSSSFHLLPEPAIPLHRADENQSIGIMGSFSSHRQRKSSETLSDKIISQMRDTDDDSEGEGWNEFGKSSPEISNEFYIQSLEPTDGLAVFSGRTAVSDADTGSPGVLSTTSRTISSSPETTRNSLLNFKCSSADAGSSSSHSRNISLGSSPRSLIVSAPHSPVSVEETCHRNQDLSLSQSPALESGASVRTSSTLEPNLECNWHEMQPTSPETCHKNEDSSQSQFSAFESGALVPTSTVELNSECHRHEDLSTSQFPAFDSRVLVPTSNLETNSECNFHELPPPPPLPPLEWRMMKPRQMPSLPLLLGVEPPTPPALPPPIMMNSSIQDDSPSLVPATQKSIVERKDSLIEAIASHDKTTLKKVPKLLHSISAKPIDDREELLEQIRTRSFNLRRTSVVKQNIPRPATNINVAAILEKANAIRQAFAGSDEDEEDEEDWSDT